MTRLANDYEATNQTTGVIVVDAGISIQIVSPPVSRLVLLHVSSERCDTLLPSVVTLKEGLRTKALRRESQLRNLFK